jgi:type I restriction enzyme R subunit
MINMAWTPQESYLDKEVDTKAIDIYQHIYSNYYGGGASTYNTYAA